jgi:hypothetical protein
MTSEPVHEHPYVSIMVDILEPTVHEMTELVENELKLKVMYESKNLVGTRS